MSLYTVRLTVTFCHRAALYCVRDMFGLKHFTWASLTPSTRRKAREGRRHTLLYARVPKKPSTLHTRGVYLMDAGPPGRKRRVPRRARLEVLIGFQSVSFG